MGGLTWDALPFYIHRFPIVRLGGQGQWQEWSISAFRFRWEGGTEMRDHFRTQFLSQKSAGAG